MVSPEQGALFAGVIVLPGSTRLDYLPRHPDHKCKPWFHGEGMVHQGNPTPLEM